MKTYTLEKTALKELFRVVNEEGNWVHYFHKPSKTYLRAVTYILDQGFAKGKHFEKWLRNNTKEESERIYKEAGEKGDKVHKFISFLFEHKGKAYRHTRVWNEETQQEELLTPQEWRCIVSFVNFWLIHEPILIKHEYPSFNLKEGYAGTLDALLILTKKCSVKTCPCNKLIGKIGLFDWKSSSGIRNSFGPQIAAYSHGENIDKIDYTAILRLGTKHVSTNGYEMEVYNKQETEDHWKEFLAAKTIHDADYREFNEKKEIYDIPENIDLKLKTNNKKHGNAKTNHEASKHTSGSKTGKKKRVRRN